MTVNLKLLTAQIIGMFAVFALALFLAAGTVLWPAGWVFLVLFLGFTLALRRWLLRHNPGLLTERMTGIGKPDQKAWDKVFYVGANMIFLAWLVLMPLDAVRFHWSQMSLFLQVVRALLLLCSFYLFFLTLRENAYLSPAVRVQTECEQTVVSTGPPYTLGVHFKWKSTVERWRSAHLELLHDYLNGVRLSPRRPG